MLSLGTLLAMAGGEGQQQGGGMSMIWMLVAFMGLMYFLMIRPQQKKEKERQEMLKRIQVGDKVRTIGGIIGVVSAVMDNTIRVRVAEKVEIEFLRDAVARTADEKPAAKKEEKKDEPAPQK